MCRIVALSNCTELAKNEKNYHSLITSVSSAMADQRDGFGVANSVSLYKTCKETRTHQAFPFTEPTSRVAHKDTGNIEVDRGALIMHGRISTNSVSLAATHPFELNGYKLIHNGVIELKDGDSLHKYKRVTSNDSEWLINMLVESLERGETFNYERDVMSKITGYAAIAMIDPMGRLTVARDDRARMNVGWSDKLNTFIFATSIEDLKGLSKVTGKIKWHEFKKNTYCLFNGNELIDQQSFKITEAMNKYMRDSMRASLGYDYDETKWPYSTKSVERDNVIWSGDEFAASVADVRAKYGSAW